MARKIRLERAVVVLGAMAAFSALSAASGACGSFGAADATKAPVEAGTAPDAPSSDAGPVEHRIFVFGGESANVLGGTVEQLLTAHVATVHVDGTMSAWSAAPAYNLGRAGAATAAVNDQFFALGGLVSLAVSATAQRAALSTAPNSVNAWSDIANLPAGSASAAAATDGTTLYVSGGRTSPTTLTDEIDAYDVAGDTWKAKVGKLYEPLAGHSTVVVGTKLYVIGGERAGAAGGELRSSLTSVAELQAKGMVPGFSNAGTLPSPTAFHAFAKIDNWFFVVGGEDSAGTSAVSTVLRGTVDATTGNVTWAVLPSLVLAEGRMGLAGACAVVVDRTIYLLGGRTDLKQPSVATVYAGVVDSAGSVSWKQLAPMPALRSLASCVVSPSSAR